MLLFSYAVSLLLLTSSPSLIGAFPSEAGSCKTYLNGWPPVRGEHEDRPQGKLSLAGYELVIDDHHILSDITTENTFAGQNPFVLSAGEYHKLELRMKTTTNENDGSLILGAREKWFRGFLVRLEVISSSNDNFIAAGSFELSEEEELNAKILPSNGDRWWSEGLTSCEEHIAGLSHIDPSNKESISTGLYFPDEDAMMRMEVTVVAEAFDRDAWYYSVYMLNFKNTAQEEEQTTQEEEQEDESTPVQDFITTVKSSPPPTAAEIITTVPTLYPTSEHTSLPSNQPTTSTPTKTPTFRPSSSPTLLPTSNPSTSSPTLLPTLNPSTSSPTLLPTSNPSTSSPTLLPTLNPSTSSPTLFPTTNPTTKPTTNPTQNRNDILTQEETTDILPPQEYNEYEEILSKKAMPFVIGVSGILFLFFVFVAFIFQRVGLTSRLRGANNTNNGNDGDDDNETEEVQREHSSMEEEQSKSYCSSMSYSLSSVPAQRSIPDEIIT